MKKLLMAAAVVAALFVSSCNSAGSNDPKAVLMSFFDALSKKDIAAARKYATADSKSMLDMMEMGMKMGGDKDTKEDKYDKSKMEFGEPKIEGDKATIAVKDKNSNESTNFTLKKESGAWKVAFDKSSMMTMGMDKMNEKGLNATDTINSNIDKMSDNMDSLNSQVKEGMEKLNENKDKIEDAAKKLEEATKKMNGN